MIHVSTTFETPAAPSIYFNFTFDQFNLVVKHTHLYLLIIKACVKACGVPSTGKRNRYVMKCSILPANIANSDWEFPVEYNNNYQSPSKTGSCQPSPPLSSGVFRISKRGSNFRWPLVLTQRGPNYVFQFFPMVKKKFFLPKGGHGPIPPKYATAIIYGIGGPGASMQLTNYALLSLQLSKINQLSGRFHIFIFRASTESFNIPTCTPTSTPPQSLEVYKQAT